MWLFCKAGYFSIVCKEGGPDDLQVRARVRQDLEALRQLCPQLGPTVETPHGDYRYRAMAKRQDLAPAIAQMVLDLDYANFKDEIHHLTGDARRMDAYHAIWGTLARWQETEARRGRDGEGPPGEHRRRTAP